MGWRFRGYWGDVRGSVALANGERVMERVRVIPTALAVAHFVGERLLGGGWENLPHLPEGEVVRPLRLARVPENIILGEE